MKVVKKHRHSINGAMMGWRVEFDTGEEVYVAYRSGRHWRGCDKHSWSVDVMTLNSLRDANISKVALVHQSSKGLMYYATNLEDFFGESSSTCTVKELVHRQLPKKAWRVNPQLNDEFIRKEMRLR